MIEGVVVPKNPTVGIIPACARCERPCRRAAEQRDELASS